MPSAPPPAREAAAELATRVVDAARAVTGLRLTTDEALLRPAGGRAGVDFQANLALPLAKRLRREPRQLADEIVAQLDVAGVAAPPHVAGPGFINFRLQDAWIASALAAMAADERLGARAGHRPQRVVVDYSAPNIAS